MKTALITEITGQGGSNLAEFQIKDGYDIHGTIRRSSVISESASHILGAIRISICIMRSQWLDVNHLGA